MRHRRTKLLWFAIIAILVAVPTCIFLNRRGATTMDKLEFTSIEAWVNLMPVILEPGQSPPKARGHIVLKLQNLDDAKLASVRVYTADGHILAENPKIDLKDSNVLHISELELSADDTVFVVIEVEKSGKRFEFRSPTAVVRPVY
ncbi:MAG: hypothetical protein DRQ10_03065 [Candidatus Hydrothermota bacterium]|nr:MAG: hypothetical protein DRQ10_03065 [Candidatus Hydrothermae bacterium]